MQRAFPRHSHPTSGSATSRVGRISRNPSDTKILTEFTTPELNERLVHKLLVEGRYAKHAGELRERLAECRVQTKRMLRHEGSTSSAIP